MTITFRAADLNSAEHFALKRLTPPSAEPLNTDIAVGTYLAFESADGRIAAGSRETAVGRQSRREFPDREEFIQVVSGRMTVQHHGDEPVELTAGSSARVTVGWRGTWAVHGPLRKVFVEHQA